MVIVNGDMEEREQLRIIDVLKQVTENEVSPEYSTTSDIPFKGLKIINQSQRLFSSFNFKLTCYDS